jgi:hypothetical protein
VGRGREPFAPAAQRYDVQVVVLRSDAAHGLINGLLADPRWALVCADGLALVFLRTDGPNADLARKAALTETTFDVAGYIRAVERDDPAPADSLFGGGTRFYLMGWREVAMRLLQRCLEHEPRHGKALNSLGRAHAERGLGKLQWMNRTCLDDLQAAKDLFLRAQRAGDKDAPQNLRTVEEDLRRARRVFEP